MRGGAKLCKLVKQLGEYRAALRAIGDCRNVFRIAIAVQAAKITPDTVVGHSALCEGRYAVVVQCLDHVQKLLVCRLICQLGADRCLQR